MYVYARLSVCADFWSNVDMLVEVVPMECMTMEAGCTHADVQHALSIHQKHVDIHIIAYVIHYGRKKAFQSFGFLETNF